MSGEEKKEIIVDEDEGKVGDLMAWKQIPYGFPVDKILAIRETTEPPMDPGTHYRYFVYIDYWRDNITFTAVNIPRGRQIHLVGSAFIKVKQKHEDVTSKLREGMHRFFQSLGDNLIYVFDVGIDPSLDHLFYSIIRRFSVSGDPLYLNFSIHASKIRHKRGRGWLTTYQDRKDSYVLIKCALDLGEITINKCVVDLLDAKDVTPPRDRFTNGLIFFRSNLGHVVDCVDRRKCSHAIAIINVWTECLIGGNDDEINDIMSYAGACCLCEAERNLTIDFCMCAHLAIRNNDFPQCTY